MTTETSSTITETEDTALPTGPTKEAKVGRADYQERLEARIERYEDRAIAAKGEAARRFEGAHGAIAGIPPGQPILVGHHSERRHRRDLERHDTNMRAGIAAEDKAAHYAGKAAVAGTGGISSDDPEALAKLESKAAGLEAQRDKMKAVNAAYDKALRAAKKAGKVGKEAVSAAWDALAAGGVVSVKLVEEWRRSGFSRDDRPYPPYTLTNLGARIRDARAREARLVRVATTPAREPVDYVHAAGTEPAAELAENRDTNRITVDFARKPGEAVRTAMHGAGFSWAPSEGVWQRKITGGHDGWWAAERALTGSGYAPAAQPEPVPPAAGDERNEEADR